MRSAVRGLIGLLWFFTPRRCNTEMFSQWFEPNARNHRDRAWDLLMIFYIYVQG